MKALTIRQPWAGAIFELGKNVENRTWSTPYRGPVLIHAASVLYGSGKRIDDLNGGSTAWSSSAIIGVVELVDVVKGRSASPWAESACWHWLLEDPTLFDKPIRIHGSLGLWETSKAITTQVLDLL